MRSHAAHNPGNAVAESVVDENGGCATHESQMVLRILRDALVPVMSTFSLASQVLLDSRLAAGCLFCSGGSAELNPGRGRSGSHTLVGGFPTDDWFDCD